MSGISVGRVGGLAVALGVGAAALSAAGVAWADAGSPDQAGSTSSSASAGRHAATGPSAAGRASRSNGSSASRTTKPAAARSALPTPALASNVITSAVTPADPSGKDTPSTPAENPTDLAGMAVARRTARAAASVAPAASQVAAAAVEYPPANCTSASTACTFVMSGSGNPTPPPGYVDKVMNMWVLPNTDLDQTAQFVYTPEGAYPVTGIKVLPLTISADQGQTILENAITAFTPGPQPGSIPVTIFGVSQSAVISSLLQRDLVDPTMIGFLPGLNRDTTTFITLGQEMNPNGGWFARYPGLNTPSVGEYWFGSTPEDAFPTTNYVLEYDGFADSPRYPGNALSSLNAALGIALIHTQYFNPDYFDKNYGYTSPAQACKDGAPSCTRLPTTVDSQAYYFIETPNLPLVAPLRLIPFIGNPLADLVQPFLKVIVDLGYADPAHGFTSATQPMANLPLPFQVFPHVSPVEVLQKLIASIPQGIHDSIACLKDAKCRTPGHLPKPPTIAEIVDKVVGIISTLPARISGGASALYATLLATVDFVNSALISLPVYDVSLVVDGVKQALSGQVIPGLINAVFRPIAADVGLGITIGVFQILVWIEGLLGALTGCGPAAPTINSWCTP